MQQWTPINVARKLRKEANTPEQMAWKALRALRQQGFPVRRQHPIGPYIVDFAIMKVRLAIEIDGNIHNLDEVRQKDEVRERRIREQGWRVLRIDAETAMSTDHLLNIVCKELKL